MTGSGPRDWMWSEALQMLAQADRMHRQMFRPQASPQGAAWEPPVDMLETDGEVLILAALPGVDPQQVQAAIEDGVLVIAGVRVVPDEWHTATIHRLELPQGRFERRIALPAGRYESVRRTAVNGCLVISLAKTPRRGRP
ncbi:MAG: Hsp20/alpha crystallin family protein [Reyranella sp.]|uniref:Hsp20/alpha crystallin family protein n=1 Tax=Reyranella sp. TaxID=1929291 RepID=UPI001219CB5D|nr:Hsp20/alpha crystallin family protein [Reyranella sp.]TAJ38367.1 MAG: Hsp20/alpha crystallin family protein [Reyranella sp.]